MYTAVPGTSTKCIESVLNLHRITLEGVHRGAVKFKLYVLSPRLNQSAEVQYNIYKNVRCFHGCTLFRKRGTSVQGPAYSIVRLGHPKLGPETSNISIKYSLNTLKKISTIFVHCRLVDGSWQFCTGTRVKQNKNWTPVASCNLLAST